MKKIYIVKPIRNMNGGWLSRYINHSLSKKSL